MMKRFAILLLLLTFTLAPQAQQQRRKAKAKTTQTTRKKTRSRKTTKTTKKKTTNTTPSVKSLQSQRQKIQQQIREQEKRLRSNQQDVKKRLQNLMMINTEIEGAKKNIEVIRHDISDIDVKIEDLIVQLENLQQQLMVCKERYVKSMRYMHRHQSAPSQLMFIFSADNLSQMYRRLRFVREYAAYQHVQGDEVKTKQEEVNRKFQEISVARSKKTDLLAQGEQEQKTLEGKQTEQQQVVKTLRREQKTIQGIISQQKKKDASLNAQIDRLIAEEVARQKARAAAEAKRRAEAEDARRRAAEQARQKAEAEARKSGKVLPPPPPAPKKAEEPLIAPSEDQRISGSFASNKGRLPMPISGSYRIVSHFGQYHVEGLRNVTLDNKGINIKGQPGAQARSIFEGEVSAVFSFGGTMVVMVRHGSYISVYCNLSSVNVHRGQKVATRQALGRIGPDNILQFQLRKETAKLNPESWIAR